MAFIKTGDGKINTIIEPQTEAEKEAQRKVEELRKQAQSNPKKD